MSVFLLLAQTFKYSTLIASFVDRDMMMHHFGTGIGHVKFVACQRNNEDDLGYELDAMVDASSAESDSELENMDISEGNDSSSNSDLEDSDSKSHSSSNTSSSSDSCSDTELSESDDADDDGYASF